MAQKKERRRKKLRSMYIESESKWPYFILPVILILMFLNSRSSDIKQHEAWERGFDAAAESASVAFEEASEEAEEAIEEAYSIGYSEGYENGYEDGMSK